MKKIQIDYDKLIERNILNKLDVIFTAMNWDISTIMPKNTSKICTRASINEDNKKKVTMYPPKVKENTQNNTQPTENKEDRTNHCECGMTFDNDKEFMNHMETKCRLNKKEVKPKIEPYYTE